MMREPTISVASRAHRALRDLKRFRFAADVSTALAERVHDRGALVGVYENPAGVDPKYIVITDQALGCIDADEQIRWISFDEIDSTHGPREKLVDDAITVVLKSGIRTQLRIAGKDGRFQDVLSFVRFFDRVMADRRPMG